MSQNDPNKAMPWGIATDGLQPGALKTISDNKLAAFAVGQQKKSRFQKQREEKEQKRKEEEAAAAKLYDSFVESFKGKNEGDDDEPLPFVRSRGSSQSQSKPFEIKLEKSADKPPSAAVAPKSETSSAKPVRQIDEYLNELKRKHELKAQAGGNQAQTESFEEKNALHESPVIPQQKGSFDVSFALFRKPRKQMLLINSL